VTEAGDHFEAEDEVSVRWEIWESFLSLLRSYGAAAGSDFILRRHSDHAQVEHKGCALRFFFNPRTGEGSWREIGSSRERGGEFYLNQDGTCQIDGRSEPLDMAAIDWIAQLKQAADVHLSETQAAIPELKSSESNHEPRDQNHL
jgi:hypothetical protein